MIAANVSSNMQVTNFEVRHTNANTTKSNKLRNYTPKECAVGILPSRNEKFVTWKEKSSY